MNIAPTIWPARRGGYALVMVMVFAAIGITVLTGTMNWAAQTSLMNERSNQLTTTLYAAEASTERVVSRMMFDFKASGESTVFANLGSYRTNVPVAAQSSYWNDFQFSNGSGTAGQSYVQRTQTQIYTNLSGPYAGLRGFVSNYRVVSNARQTTGRFALTNAVQQDLQLASIPVFQFAIFFNSLLEFVNAAPLTVRGRVHANSNIFLGSPSALTLVEAVTATGFVQKYNWFGFSMADYTGAITYGSTVTSNTSALTLPISTNNTSAAVREVINIPPTGESMSSAMGQQRFFNKAEMLILVSNATVTVRVKTPFDASPLTIPWTNANFFITTNLSFTDQREGKTMRVTELDLSRFRTWAATNTSVIAKLGAGNTPNLIYVADDRSVTTSQRTAVRLINGQTLPARGLTLATVNPLYVRGHFNCTNNAHLGTTNTTSTRPASLIADALTIQSGAWSDGASAASYTSRVASDTTINAALLAGMVYTSADGVTSKSGGVVNFPRLLEAWSGRTLTLNGSLVNLFDSMRATAQFQVPGIYYNAPTRNFNFDPNFLDSTRLPPGSPELRVLIRGAWAAAPPNRTNYVASF